MKFFSMLAAISATMSLISVTTQQLTTETGCVFNFDNPVECVFSWIFFTSDECSTKDFINCYINTSTCETLVKGGNETMILGSTSTIPASKPGLVLPLTLSNPTAPVGPIFNYNGTTFDASDCTCGPGPNMTDSTGYACSCPFDCTSFNNVPGK